MTIRILLADDQPLIRAGFRMILEDEDDMTVVGEAADGAQAARLASELRSDVALMDVRMPGTDGIEATRRVVAETPSARVLALTTFDLDEYVFTALRYGASGFLLKDAQPAELATAVRAVASGDAVVAPRVTRRLLDAFASRLPGLRSSDQRDPVPELARLTDRERDVLVRSAGWRARPAGTAQRAGTPVAHDDPRTSQARDAMRIPPHTDAQGNNFADRWPLHSFLELGALPGAVPCARLHARQVLWEWNLTDLADSTELLVSELVTNAIQVSRADAHAAPVRLWLLADRARVLVLVLVWDDSPPPPVPVSADGTDESGRGLLLVDAISQRWGTYQVQAMGRKVVWAMV